MKCCKILLLALMSLSVLAQEKAEILLKTDVSEATVFITGAQVVRKKTIDIQIGKSTLKFTNLSPYIDGKSVQLKVNGEIMVLSVDFQLNYTDSLKHSSEQNKHTTRLEELNDKIEIEKANLSTINQELEFLNANKNIGGNAQGVNLTNLRETANYYRERISNLKLKEIGVRKNIESLSKEKVAIEKQLGLITNTRPTPSGEVLVKINSKAAVKCNLELSYFVNNASWYPSYDIRANTIEDPIELIYKATIQQNTKEDWKNIKLKISSGNPNLSNVAPVLKTYFLNYYTKPPKYDGTALSNQISGRVLDQKSREPLPGASITIKGSTIGTVCDMDGNFTLSIPRSGEMLQISFIGYESQVLPISTNPMTVLLKENSNSLDEVVVVGYGVQKNALQGKLAGVQVRGISSTADSKPKETNIPVPVSQVENQTTVEFEIKTPYTINSDNKSVTVEMEKYNLPAQYEYYAVPKVEKSAFLLANVVDWEKYNLLEGEANIFFENTFIGKTVLDVRYMSDTLNISLGRDKNVVINREKVKEFNTKQFLGSKKEDTRSWKLSVKNNKKQKINFVLIDQIPLSTMSEIEVITENLSGGVLNKETGEVKWRIELLPGNKHEAELKYKVKYPKDRTLTIE